VKSKLTTFETFLGYLLGTKR